MRMAVTSADRLAVTLRCLPTGDSCRSLSYTIKIAKQLISIVLEVRSATAITLSEYVEVRNVSRYAGIVGLFTHLFPATKNSTLQCLKHARGFGRPNETCWTRIRTWLKHCFEEVSKHVSMPGGGALGSTVVIPRIAPGSVNSWRTGRFNRSRTFKFPQTNPFVFFKLC